MNMSQTYRKAEAGVANAIERLPASADVRSLT